MVRLGTSRGMRAVVVILVASIVLLGLGVPASTSSASPLATPSTASAPSGAAAPTGAAPRGAAPRGAAPAEVGRPPLAVRGLSVSRATLAVYDPSRSTPARGAVPGHAGRDLPTTVWYPTTGGPYPLVVFAHGYNTTPGAYAALTSSLASAGYIVAAPALPGARSDIAGTPQQSDIPNQPRDLSFVTDAVLAANATWTSFLFGRVDGSRIGAMGHSDGGVVTAAMSLNSATVDHRLQATAVLSGGQWPIPGGTWGAVQAGSVLVAHGNADAVAPYSDGVSVWNAARSPRAFLTALGGSHEGPYTGGGAQADAMRASIADFFDLKLRGDLAGAGALFTDGNRAGLTQLSPDGISANPLGYFDAASRAGNQSVHLQGWAIDPDTDSPVPVAVFVDGRRVVTADAASTRVDLPFFFPSFSAQHGLDTYVPLGPGVHTFCLFAGNLGNGDGDTWLGCRNVTVYPQVVGGPAVSNFDGRLEVFAVQADGLIRHTWQRWPGGAWDAWSPFGDQHVAGGVSVATNDDGRLEVFGVGTDGQLWHIWQVCPGCWWSEWVPMGGSWRPDGFSVAANGDGRLEVFAIATDGTLQHIWQPAPRAGWSEWYSLNAPWTPSPSLDVPGVVAGRQADGRLVAASVNPAGQLVVVVQAGPGIGWGYWQVLGGAIAGAPILGVNQDLRLESFAVGADGQLWHAYLGGDNSWSAAAPLGGSFDAAAGITTTNTRDQRLDVFGSAPGTHAVTHVAQVGPNAPWQPVSLLGGSGTRLAAASNPDGRMELFSVALPVTHSWETAPDAGWSPFSPL